MTSENPLPAYRWLEPFTRLLRQGISPERISLTIALGIVLGVTPVLGSTVLLCTLAAVLFNLNLPAIQFVNGVAYPLQIILLIPFYKLGGWIFGADTHAISFQGIAAMARAGPWHAIQVLWVVTLHALIAWMVLSAFTTAILYAILVPLMRKLWTRVSQS